jgi:preprotein translocase YajC subunit
MSDASIISAVVIAIVAYVYVTIIRPARKEQMRHRQQMRDLRPGDQVLTTANIVATVADIQVQESGPALIRLEIAEGVVVTALPGAILRRMGPASASNASKQEGTAST